MVTALQWLYQYSRKEAEQTFANGVVWTKEEFNNKLQKNRQQAKRHSF